MPSLSVKNVPGKLLRRLKQRAAKNHRSMQGELMVILEDAVEPVPRLTPHQLLQRVRALGVETPSEAVEMIRKDRDSR